MDYKIFDVEHARSLTLESDSLFEQLINDCWKEMKAACGRGEFALIYEYSAVYKSQIDRFVKLLKEAGYSAKTVSTRSISIDWSLSIEELSNTESGVQS